MNELEQRLARELWAESETITPDGLPALRLPGAADPAPRRRRTRWGKTLRLARRPERWPGWAVPLAAAAAVVAVIVGTLAVVHGVPGAPAPGGGSVTPTQPPAYYAHSEPRYQTGQSRRSLAYGSQAVQIRGASTGRLLTTVRPPHGDVIGAITADASGTEFVFTVETLGTHIGGRTVVGSAGFETLLVTPAGGTELSTLTLPFSEPATVEPSLALSPDGSKLALAYGGFKIPETVRVVTLTTGAVQTWTGPVQGSWWPMLPQQGAWSADGRLLTVTEKVGFIQVPTSPGAKTFKSIQEEQVRMFQPSSGSSTLRTTGLLTLRLPGQGDGGQYAPAVLIPDGATLIVASGVSRPDPRNSRDSLIQGGLSEFSVRTGARLRVLAPWQATERNTLSLSRYSPRQAVLWSTYSGSQLVVLQPQDGANQLGVLTGGQVVLGPGGLLPGREPAYRELQNAAGGYGALAW